jgi:uncharacterized 2Fe-2S/4Fe-4S cluster protein (DUF4445 family)
MADTVSITYVDPEDVSKEKSTTIERGKTLLEAGHAAGIEIEATCGERGRCRTCRVKIVSGEVPPPTIQDTVQLGHEEVRENFRLACQTKVIANTKVMALPPKAEIGHQILSSDQSLADDDRMTLDCGVAKYVVKATTPMEEHHQTSDWEEMLSVLPDNVSRDVSLEVLRKVPGAIRAQSGNMTVTTFNDRITDVEAGDTAEHKYGMAFDIGTTSIVGTLINLETGETLADIGGVNPQAIYGGDLMSRIAYAQFDEKKLATLRGRALNALNDFIRDASQQAQIEPSHIYKIVIVGNTCMHHIILGVDVTYVGLAPYAPVIRDAFALPARDLPLKRAVNAQVCFLPIVAGFVGADTMACVLATRIYDSEEIRTLVDIGTNGEVVMGSKDRLMVCSAPAGPALEGAQIRHGMRGALGAIEKIAIDDDISCTVIGDTPAIGICGSGLIDACAKLATVEVLEKSGRLRRKKREDLPETLRNRLVDTPDGCEFILVNEDKSGKEEPIALTQADIRQVQLAKSAIFSGIVMLQQVMDLPDEDLEEVMMCGGFGNYINIESAVKIRLIPNLPLEKITYSGNAALMGAQMALLSETERNRAFDLSQQMEHVALAARPEFQDIFVEAMSFLGPETPVGWSADLAPQEAVSGGE